MCETVVARWQLRLDIPIAAFADFLSREIRAISGVPFAYEESGMRGVMYVYSPRLPPSIEKPTTVSIPGFIESLSPDARAPSFGKRTATLLSLTPLVSGKSIWIFECKIPSFAAWLETFIRHCQDRLGSACEVIEGPGGMGPRPSPQDPPSSERSVAQDEPRPDQTRPRP